MSCPACGQALSSGHERCASCGAVVAPAVEGALAPDPAPAALPGRDRIDTIRDLAGQRKRTWKDEVKDRVRNRRQQKSPGGVPEPSAAELPLFEASEPRAAEAAAVRPAREPVPTERREERELRAPDPSSVEMADLPLHPGPAPEARPDPRPWSAPAVEPARRGREAGRAGAGDFDDGPLPSAEDEWPQELPARPREREAVERPAFARERALAAGLDVGLLLGTAAAVVYFASRAARVSASGLLPTWPWILGYLAFLGLVYSGYFSGTTGQTLGKMAAGLRVVDVAGHPPGFLRAFGRSLVGVLGVALLGLGLLPMLFDPARRALHDRLFRMRVVRR